MRPTRKTTATSMLRSPCSPMGQSVSITVQATPISRRRSESREATASIMCCQSTMVNPFWPMLSRSASPCSPALAISVLTSSVAPAWTRLCLPLWARCRRRSFWGLGPRPLSMLLRFTSVRNPTPSTLVRPRITNSFFQVPTSSSMMAMTRCLC